MRPAELAPSVLQTVENNYTEAADYRTYRLANRPSKYEASVSCFIAKLVKKVKSQMEARFFNQKKSFLMIRFLATLKLACDTNNIYE